MEKLKEFTLNFFSKLGADIVKKEDIYTISNVTKSFEDLVARPAPYQISFSAALDGVELLNHSSSIFRAINKYLENSGKTTLVRIDFEEDMCERIKSLIKLKNCEIENLTKQHKNNFFSRFSFLTTFQYLNKKEQALNEIYVHEGEIVAGDLSGYKIVDGEKTIEDTNFLKNDYEIAKRKVQELTINKIEQISDMLEQNLNAEIAEIENHYSNLLGEIGGDLNSQLNKISALDLELRSTEDEEKCVEIRAKIERLRKGLIKKGDDDAKSRVMKEKAFSINNAKQKNSLNVANKILNTTIIYYPIFQFKLYIKGDNTKRFIELNYNPLTQKMDDLRCENCNCILPEIQIDEAGHLTCSNCMSHCSECGKVYCDKCLAKSCHVCGKPLCKNCSKVCFGCGKYTCPNHLRNDCVTGEERCTMCLRACLRCHGVTEEKYFAEALDGSKVCQKCIAEERRNKIMKNVFDE